MFGGSEKTTPPGRYRVEIVSGEMREKSRERKVQEALNTGATMGWRLVSASTTNGTGTYVTGIYWDTTPER